MHPADSDEHVVLRTVFPHASQLVGTGVVVGIGVVVVAGGPVVVVVSGGQFTGHSVSLQAPHKHVSKGSHSGMSMASLHRGFTGEFTRNRSKHSELQGTLKLHAKDSAVQSPAAAVSLQV